MKSECRTLAKATPKLAQRVWEASEAGVLDEAAVTSFAERQRLVDKATFDMMELRYATGAPTV